MIVKAYEYELSGGGLYLFLELDNSADPPTSLGKITYSNIPWKCLCSKLTYLYLNWINI